MQDCTTTINAADTLPSSGQDYHTLLDVFDRACQRYGTRPAFTSLGYSISFQELERQSRAFAAYLQCHTDLQPGDRIAIQLPNLIQYPVVLFGALRAGLVVVNTNPLYTTQEMLHQFSDAGIRALVVLSNLADKVEKILPRFGIDHLIITDLGDALPLWRRLLVNTVVRHVKKLVPAYQLPSAISYRQALGLGQGERYQAPDIDPDDLAILQYTGGTTGIAKGAMLSHSNLVANVRQVKKAIGGIFDPEGEIAIAPLPLYHIYSFTVNCMVMMEAGVQVVLIANPRDIPAFVKELKRYRFSFFTGLNTLFVALCKNPEFQKLDFSRLKVTLSGGMALTRSAADSWRAVTGHGINEGYGLTETSPVVSLNPPGSAQLGTIGVPMPETEVRLIDDEGAVVPVGGVGELCVRGPQVMQGYWKQPLETDAVLDADGWFRTGDVAQVQDDGYIRIVDRKKDMIIVSGFNVYPGELEEVIVSHPDVEECAVVGLPHEVTGEQIKAYVVSRNAELTVKELRDYCRERLTAYKVPALVEFRSELPKSNVGKVLRRQLRDAERQGNGRSNGNGRAQQSS
ncbi:AMP-binding protein [Motiliproteus sediminis]|uniref:AMP-binding protein n=1 Tax=Motiliproteus sediminis TaxID=1468178 RepID=UPI001AEFDE55|nr:AMP-binding protein [Motiliproteus sediminis]